MKRILTLVALAMLVLPGTVAADYSRSEFGSGWADLDGNGCDTREDMLREAAILIFEQDGCTITYGLWYSSWDGDFITNPSTLDIDHIVPLKWAWDNGAAAWLPVFRVWFANDPENLRVVSSGVNRQKRDNVPPDWMPRYGATAYVADFLHVIAKYALRYN